MQRVKMQVTGIQEGAKEEGRGLEEQVEAHRFLHRCRLKLVEGKDREC